MKSKFDFTLANIIVQNTNSNVKYERKEIPLLVLNSREISDENKEKLLKKLNKIVAKIAEQQQQQQQL